jgi:hypothetical protein
MQKVPGAFNENEYYISTTQIISSSNLISHVFVIGAPRATPEAWPCRGTWNYFYSSRDLKRSPEFKIYQRLFRFIAF